MVFALAKSFRSLEISTPESRKDDILRAAITAFAALSSPSKHDCNQIEDLGLSLLPFTSESTRRFAAAALSNCADAPAALVRRLCDEPADVCAPLLLRSSALSPVDLVSVIGRHGKAHARVIAGRKHLPNAVIEALALIDDPQTRNRVETGNIETIDPMKALANLKPVSADAARKMLLDIMIDTGGSPKSEAPTSEPVPAFLPREAAKKLTELALKEQDSLFVTAIADMTGLSFSRALKLLRRTSAAELATVLKSFEIDGPTAYLICSAFFPEITRSRTDMRLFLDRHDAQDCLDAIRMVEGWRADDREDAERRETANADFLHVHKHILKVS